MWGWLIGGAVAAGALGWALGPRARLVPSARFDDAQLAQGVDAYLAGREAQVPGVKSGVEKRVIWAGEAETQTDWAVVYVHGFSATSEELRPLPDLVAEGLGANLMFTRLTGHGRDGPAMAEATAGAWMADVAEALAVGRAIGRRVLVMGCSTGCPLITLALHDPEMSAGVAGAVMVAPNYRVKDPKAAWVTLPWARLWLPLLAGRERGFVPQTKAHGYYWTARYPSIAVLPMGAAVKAADALDHGAARVPALFVFDDRDALVDHAKTREVAEAWGARSEVFAVETGEGDDKVHHVIAGDIMSPGLTVPIAEKILDWARALDEN